MPVVRPSSRTVLWPYNMFSESAKDLAAAFNCLRVRSTGRYRPRFSHRIINWGNSSLPAWSFWPERMLNLPQYVERAASKIQTMEVVEHSPDWTTSRAVAEAWLTSEKKWPKKLNAVVCRTLTRANSGKGIVLAKTVEEMVNAPLYTRYTPKTDEYRVHVFKEVGVIDVQQKRQVAGGAENKYIRNHPFGWVFCRENIQVPNSVVEAAEQAVLTLNLDFGAVDIGFHPEIGTYVYEVNTAPGLEGQTLNAYTTQFNR